MNMPECLTGVSTDQLVVEIVSVLEAHGMSAESYTLCEYVDPEALQKVISSADGDLEIRLTVGGVQLSITQDGVHTVNKPSTDQDQLYA